LERRGGEEGKERKGKEWKGKERKNWFHTLLRRGDESDLVVVVVGRATGRRVEWM